MLSGKICLQHKILGFANGTNVNTKNDKSLEPMSDSFFHAHISLASVTTKTLPQMVEETWCQNPTHPAWQPHCSNVDETASKHSMYSPTLHQLTSIFLALWRSILVVTCTKMLWKSRKLSHTGFIH